MVNSPVHSSSDRFSRRSTRGQSWAFCALVSILFLGEWSCATHVPSMADPTEVINGLVVGRALTFLTGERARRYLPKMRFLELEHQDSRKRFQVEIDSPDQTFVISLPPGRYRLTRVQVSEGPFLSMAEFSMTFAVDSSAVTYVGTWRFGVDSPRYGRMVVASVVIDQAEIVKTQDFLMEQYPDFAGFSFVERLPEPSQAEARLYEVMPYPRYPRYFRRHWW